MRAQEFIKKSRHGRALLPAILFLCMMAVSAVTGFASEPFDPDRGGLSVKQVGTIDRMTRDIIVIDDCLYRYSDRIRCLTRDGEEISLAYFSKRERVIYVIDSGGRVSLLQKEY